MLKIGGRSHNKKKVKQGTETRHENLRNRHLYEISATPTAVRGAKRGRRVGGGRRNGRTDWLEALPCCCSRVTRGLSIAASSKGGRSPPSLFLCSLTAERCSGSVAAAVNDDDSSDDDEKEAALSDRRGSAAGGENAGSSQFEILFSSVWLSFAPRSSSALPMSSSASESTGRRPSASHTLLPSTFDADG